MGQALGTFSGRSNHRMRLETQVAGQNIAGNYSSINFQLYIERTAASSSYYLTRGGGGTVTIQGQNFGVPAFLYDFRTTASYTLLTGSLNVGHASDGTLTYSLGAIVNAPGTLGSASGSSAEAVARIPRATVATVTPASGETAQSFTIGHIPADASFVHDIFYSLNSGSSYTQIGSNVPGTTTSTVWTPAHTLLTNQSDVVATILVRTKSGGTTIGDYFLSLPLHVPDSVKPVIQNVTWEDTQTSNPDIPTLMGGPGRFVQRWSKLRPTITSVGAGGSTVVSSTVTQGGQVTASGSAFAQPVALSGLVPFSGVVTDSRSRNSDQYANLVAVTAYNFPSLPTPLVARTSDAAGAIPSPTGTYIAITPLASVSSLVFGGVEKNLLEWRVRTKTLGGSYVTKQDWTTRSVSGNTWTTKYVAGGGYLSSTEYVVEISVRDSFGKSGYSAEAIITLEVPVRSENVFMDWDGPNGFGIGKFRTNGMLDIEGQVYQNHGLAVLDTESIKDSLLAYIPAGTVSMTANAAPPAGYLLCNGATVLRATYDSLFLAIGTTYGAGNGTTTFTLPTLASISGIKYMIKT